MDDLTEAILAKLNLFNDIEEDTDILKLFPELGPASLSQLVEKQKDAPQEKSINVIIPDTENFKTTKARNNLEVETLQVNHVSFHEDMDPVNIHAFAVLKEIAVMIKLPRFDSNSFKISFASPASCRVLEDAFWYIHLLVFDTSFQNKMDKQAKQEVLLRRLCIHFAKFIMYAKKGSCSDLIFSTYYHYVICKAVVLSFNKTFPLSFFEFTPQFIQKVHQILLPLFTGVAFDVAFHNQIINQLFGEKPLKDRRERGARSTSLPSIHMATNVGSPHPEELCDSVIPIEPPTLPSLLPNINDPKSSHRSVSLSLSTQRLPQFTPGEYTYEDNEKEDLEIEEDGEDDDEIVEEGSVESDDTHPRANLNADLVVPTVYSFDSYSTSPLITRFFQSPTVPSIHRKLVHRTVRAERTKNLPETMYYKDSNERNAIPKQLLAAYMEVKASVENKRKKIKKNVSSDIAAIYTRESEEMAKRKTRPSV